MMKLHSFHDFVGDFVESSLVALEIHEEFMLESRCLHLKNHYVNPRSSNIGSSDIVELLLDSLRIRGELRVRLGF